MTSVYFTVNAATICDVLPVAMVWRGSWVVDYDGLVSHSSEQAVVMSVYAVTETQKLWIITEADRSATTILFPDDY